MGMCGIRVGMIRIRGIRVGDDGNVWNQGGNAEIRVRTFL